MSNEENKAIVRRYLEAVWNEQDLSVIDQYIAPDYLQHAALVTQGREGVKRFFAMVRTAFPDARAQLEDLIAEGDRVVWRMSLTATHTGPFHSLPPSGKRVSWSVISIARMEGGMFREHWNVTDQLGLLQQIGAVPQL